MSRESSAPNLQPRLLRCQGRSGTGRGRGPVHGDAEKARSRAASIEAARLRNQIALCKPEGVCYQETMKNKTPQPTSLTDSLNQVLADSYALMALTHSAHWNVEGPGFFALHTAFQTQYEELFTAIDEIAERIRALGAYAIGGLNTFAQTAAMQEFAAPLPQEEYVRRLIAANSKLLADAAQARDLAGQANDAESQDLMIQRITLHQKTVWMLQSFLKG